MRTIPDLITACGGIEKIVEAAGKRPNGLPNLSHWAVRKWAKNGIPEWHWPLVMSLATTSTDELHAANEAARAAEHTPAQTPAREASAA